MPDDRAVEVALYLTGEGKDAPPAEHLRVLGERWPELSREALQRALDLLCEFRTVDEAMPPQ